MRELVSGHSSKGGFVRSALLLAASILAIAVLLAPYAVRQTGSAGLLGLVAAGAISLLSGWMSEGLAHLFSHVGTPLAGLMTSMAARLLLPLAVCLGLAAQGVDGRQHLAFVCYLLAFYMVTLAVETWLAVKRINRTTTIRNHASR